MKRMLIAIAATTLLTGLAVAQAGGPMGRGMPGPGMMGYGTMGPGMMGYGAPSFGYGPMGPGMMGGDMGACPMTGYGMMGHGPAGFDARVWSLGLNDAQRDKILAIERAASRKQWELMGKMHDQSLRAHESYATGKWDEDALRKNFEVVSEVHKGLFETSLQARKDIEAVLTPEQRSQLNSLGGTR
jgi:Spy/CpxP family protein refolding chaperone